MPLQLLHGKIRWPLHDAHDVQTLFEYAISLTTQKHGSYEIERYRRDLLDHLYYIGALHPGYFRPLQPAVVQLSDAALQYFAFPFQIWLYLLHDAPDICVEVLVNRLSNASDLSPLARFALEEMLAGIGTPAGLTALAAYARQTQQRKRFAEMGFWLDDRRNLAVPRFTLERWAARRQSYDDSVTIPELAGTRNPVGLPVAAIVEDQQQETIMWHYCSLDVSTLPGMPSLRAARLHLVSPAFNDEWTVFCAVTPDNLYQHPRLMKRGGKNRTEMSEMRDIAEQAQMTGKGYLDLLPYDDALIYCNGNVLQTLGVVGRVGGPPDGLASIPSCPQCKMLMFFICAVTANVREYGYGLRGLYVCENCMIAASQALPWN